MSGFAYAIDYAAEIARGEAEVANLTSEAQVAISAEVDPKEVNPNSRFTFYDFILVADPEVRTRRAAIFGLTNHEAVCCAWGADEGQFKAVCDATESPYEAAATDREVLDAENRFDAALKAVEGVLEPIDEATRKALLKRAKSTLARHKRNQKKHGSK